MNDTDTDGGVVTMDEKKLYVYLYHGADDIAHYALSLEMKLGIPIGSIYLMLIRLERRGHLTSEWEVLGPDASRRPRRLYKLTGPGYLKAKQLAEAL